MGMNLQPHSVRTGPLIIGPGILAYVGGGPPSPPTGVTAVADGENVINVSWNDVTDETGFRVERSADGAAGWADVSGNLAAGTTSFGDTGLSPSTQYFYRVFAFNAVGDSDPSTVVSATTDSGGGGGGGNFCCDGFDCLTQDPFACRLS